MLPDTQIRIPEHVLSQKLDNETVLLNVQTGSYFGLTPVASRIWELLKAGEQPKLIPDLLAAEFDASRELVESDLLAFFAMLRGKQLITY